MGLNKQALGFSTEEIVHTYSWQDVVLYALSIGAKREDLDYIYESRGPLVYPSYAVIPAYRASFAAWNAIGGNPLGIVHHAQKLVINQIFKGSGKLLSIGKVTGIYDLKRMARATITVETSDQKGNLICETEFSIIFRFDGNFGGDPPPRRISHKPPDRDPDFVVKEITSREQAALYRLNGDTNPLHIDPTIAKAAGFEKPILHGLCTYGFICRSLVHEVARDNSKKIRELYGEFRQPVIPGETLVIQGWKEMSRVYIRVSTQENPERYVFQNAYAELENI